MSCDESRGSGPKRSSASARRSSLMTDRSHFQREPLMAAKFELVSKFQPAGDQPQAIEKLVEGYGEGKSAQVLLGATGTGKSLAWNEPVLVRRPCPDGGHELAVVPIGALVDEAFGRSPPGSVGPDSEVAAPPDGTEALSFNPSTCQSEWKLITAFSRHATPARMYRVRTECGREVTVTGDHNFFTLRSGEIGLRETADLGRDDYIPLPRSVESGGELRRIDLLEVVGDADHLEVDAPEAFRW